MDSDALQSFFRKALTILGTVLVQKGWITSADNAELASGLAVLAVSFYLSWRNTQQAKRELHTAIAAQPGTPVEVVKKIAADKTQAPPFGPLVLLVIAAQMSAWGCAAKSAPVVVAQASLGMAQSIEALQVAAIDLHKQGVITTEQALRVQTRLLSVNSQVEKIVPYLKAADRLTQGGVAMPQGELDALLTQVYLALEELGSIYADVPASSEAKAFLALVRQAQTTMTTTMIEVARLRVALEK